MVMARDLGREFDAAQDALVDLRDESDVSVDALQNAQREDGNDIKRLLDIARRHRKVFLICRSGRGSLMVTDALALRDNSPAAREAHTHDWCI